MKNFYTLLIALLTLSYAQAQSIPWFHAKQGTPTWPGANAKDIYTDATGVVSVGDFGLIDIFEGEAYIAKHDHFGNLFWENTFDHAGTLEIVQHVSPIPSDGGFLISCLLADGYRPWFIKTDATGNLVWSSEIWTDPFPENSASHTYSYQLPGGDIAIVIMNDISKFISYVTVDNATGTSISTNTITYDDISVYTPIYATTTDVINQTDGSFTVCLAVTTVDSTYGQLSRLSSSLTVEMAQTFGFDMSYPMALIQTADGDYTISGSCNTGGFFGDLWTAMISDMNYDGTDNGSAFIPGGLLHSTGFSLIETTTGDYRLVRYNFSGFSYGENPGDYVEIISLNTGYDEYDAATFNYAPYNIIEIIQTLNDGYVVGGSSWSIGVPSYYMLVATDGSENFPACIFNCVWPGDADNNGTADMDDLLAIGLGYGTSGIARPEPGNDWYAHASENWADVLPDGTNLKYVDCNGDATINDDDTLAINLNYLNTHAVYSLKTSGGDIPLFLAPTEPTLHIGLNEIPIMLGDVLNPANEIYGLRFSIEISGESIDSFSTNIKFNDSWFGTEAELLQMNYNFPDELVCDAAIVRTNQTNASGYGEIGILNLVVIDNIAGKTTTEDIEFNIIDVRAINADMDELTVTADETIISTGINDIDKSSINIYPNPVTENNIFIQSIAALQNVSILNMLGEELISYNNINSNSIEVPELNNGQYIVKVITDRGIFTQNIIFLQK